MKVLKTLILSLLITTSALAQGTAIDITASSNIITGDHFKPYSNKWKMYAQDAQGNETIIRIWTDYAQTISLNGKKYVSRIQELYDANMQLVDLWTNLFEHKTLLPYRASQFKTNGNHLYLEFDGDEVKSSTKAGNADAVLKTHKMTQPVYDWTMYGVLLSGLPFKKGQAYNLPIFSQQSPTGQGTLVATVEDKEMIKDDNGKSYSTWKISTNVGLVFWVTKKAPYVIQLTSPGQNGGQTIWRIF